MLVSPTSTKRPRPRGKRPPTRRSAALFAHVTSPLLGIDQDHGDGKQLQQSFDPSAGLRVRTGVRVHRVPSLPYARPVRAMILDKSRGALREGTLPDPVAGPGEVLIDVHACGICRTDLHVVDGELEHPKLPLVPGHQIVGRVLSRGRGRRAVRARRPRRRAVARVDLRRVRVLPIGPREPMRAGAVHGLRPRRRLRRADRRGRALLLPDPRRLSRRPGRAAAVRGADRLPGARMAGDGDRVGLYGFGASAHIVTQVLRHQGRRVVRLHACRRRRGSGVRPGAGCEWAGDALGPPPEPLDAAIIFAPVGDLVPAALRAVGPGGIVVCAGIHMSDIPSFPYELLWRERVLRSVANLTRRDGEEFMALAPRAGAHRGRALRARRRRGRRSTDCARATSGERRS